MANLISKPKWPTQTAAEEFRLKMVALGGRWNNTYNAWNVTDEKFQEAIDIRAQYPDNEYVAPVNGSTIKFG